MRYARVGLLLLIPGILLVSLVAFWSEREGVTQPSALQPVERPFSPPITSDASASAPPAREEKAKDAVAKQNSISATATRASIFDSADIVATALRVRISGTPDEKSYAADALSSCHLSVESDSRPEAVRQQLASIRDLARNQDSPELKTIRVEAEANIRKQCSGFIGMADEQRLELIQALRSGAGPTVGKPLSSRQTLVALDTRLRDEDRRWSTAEAELVSASLHGDDAVLRRDAFGLLYSSIDLKAAYGKERREALLMAVGAEMTGPSLSTLESREACVNAGRCGNDASTLLTGSAPEISAETARLIAMYKDAFEKRLPYEKIMSIR